MPNGGHICCEYCTYSRSQRGICDIFGHETSPGILCRSFRMPKQTHSSARRKWRLLLDLKPGIVYGIDNNVFSAGNPRPLYKMVPVDKET